LGIEVEHDLATTQVGQADGRAVVRLELEVGGDVVRLQHAWAPGRVPGNPLSGCGVWRGGGGAARPGGFFGRRALGATRRSRRINAENAEYVSHRAAERAEVCRAGLRSSRSRAVLARIHVHE